MHLTQIQVSHFPKFLPELFMLFFFYSASLSAFAVSHIMSLLVLRCMYHQNKHEAVEPHTQRAGDVTLYLDP